MRNANRFIVLIVALAVLSACASVTNRGDTQSMVLYGHHFGYSLENRESVQLIQVFDDGVKTYFQFRGSPPEGLTIHIDSEGKGCPFELSGSFVVIEGVHARLVVTVGQNSTLVRNEESPPTVSVGTTSAAQFAVGPPISSSPAVMPATGVSVPRVTPKLPQDTGSLQAKMDVLQERLEQAHRAGRGAMLVLKSTNGVLRLVIRFEDNSSAVHIDEGVINALSAAAKAARRIHLHGRTDSLVESEAATALVIARAAAVKKLFISLGVAADRIRLFYHSAGDFAEDNSTEEGRAANQRVEIQMFAS
jgi:outer membrane protein OmpA-like peptidoglycan-associated protein